MGRRKLVRACPKDTSAIIKERSRFFLGVCVRARRRDEERKWPPLESVASPDSAGHFRVSLRDSVPVLPTVYQVICVE